MKKAFFAAMAAVLLLAGCKDKDWCKTVEQKEDAFMEFLFSLNEDGLTREQVEQKVDSAYTQLQHEVGILARKGLAEHPDDSVTVFLVKEMYDLEILDNDGLLKAIQDMGPNAQADPVISKLKANVEKVLATGEGTHFLDFSIRQPGGKVKKLSDYAGKGKYCLVDFWASWCGPCKGEIPNLKAIHKEYGPKGLEMVSVAVWDDPKASADTAKAYGINWNQILDAQRIPTDLYGIQGIPHIMLIGPDGTILKRDLRGADIAAEISRYL